MPMKQSLVFAAVLAGGLPVEGGALGQARGGSALARYGPSAGRGGGTPQPIVPSGSTLPPRQVNPSPPPRQTNPPPRQTAPTQTASNRAVSRPLNPTTVRSPNGTGTIRTQAYAATYGRQ